MKQILRKATWSPYIAGAGIGVLTWLTYTIASKSLGITTAFVRIVGFLIGIVSTDYVSDTPYLSQYVEFKPVFEWQVALALGILIGAFLSAKLSGVTFSFIPYQWGQRFGFSKRVRAIGAFVGGLLLILGARLAGGCTLSLAVSGGLELATKGWLFLAVFFVSGVITAHILYRKN